ncbi:MAG: hypothetical protein V4515_07345 [Chloroflexota bacterium]
MKRHLTRLAGPLTGLLLATVLVATPALAASVPAGHGRSASVPQAEEREGRARCADAWLAARAEPSVANLKTVGFCEIDRRLATIERLGKAVDESRALTDDHAAALNRILDDSAAGLRTLRAKIAADTTVEELRADIRSIFTEFRIYALVTRQVWLVRGADTVDMAGARLETASDRLEAMIAQAEANGKDVTEANAHLAAMQTAIADALAAVDGVADDILPLTPADWNAGTAGLVLRSAHEAITSARADLRTATAEARKVIASLAG